jgi:hypothetical protein
MACRAAPASIRARITCVGIRLQGKHADLIEPTGDVILLWSLPVVCVVQRHQSRPIQELLLRYLPSRVFVHRVPDVFHFSANRRMCQKEEGGRFPKHGRTANVRLRLSRRVAGDYHFGGGMTGSRQLERRGDSPCSRADCSRTDLAGRSSLGDGTEMEGEEDERKKSVPDSSPTGLTAYLGGSRRRVSLTPPHRSA